MYIKTLVTTKFISSCKLQSYDKKWGSQSIYLLKREKWITLEHDNISSTIDYRFEYQHPVRESLFQFLWWIEKINSSRLQNVFLFISIWHPIFSCKFKSFCTIKSFIFLVYLKAWMYYKINRCQKQNSHKE